LEKVNSTAGPRGGGPRQSRLLCLSKGDRLEGKGTYAVRWRETAYEERGATGRKMAGERYSVVREDYNPRVNSESKEKKKKNNTENVGREERECRAGTRNDDESVAKNHT